MAERKCRTMTFWIFWEKVWKSILLPTWLMRASMDDPPCKMRKRMSTEGVRSFNTASREEREGGRGGGVEGSSNVFAHVVH